MFIVDYEVNMRNEKYSLKVFFIDSKFCGAQILKWF